MSVQVSGTVKAPASVTTHTEPNSPITGPIINSGAGQHINVGTFANTGNVIQTLTVNSIDSPTNCIIDEFHITHDGVANDGHTYHLAPGQEVQVIVFAEAPAEAPGTPDATYSFSVNTTWS